jgi:hypothetical protein
MPDAVPPGTIKTPDEEVRINRVFIDRALKEDLTFVTLVLHPWSMNAFDPEMGILRQTFEYVQGQVMGTTTYYGLCQHMWQQVATASPH